MNTETLLVLFAGVCLAALLAFKRAGSGAGVWLTKPLLSLLFVLAAWIRPWTLYHYAALIVLGLCFCFCGDVLLIAAPPRRFLAGLVAFLVGHVCYAAAFFLTASPSGATLFGAAAAAPLSAFIFFWLRSRLGRMRAAVGVYIIVITVMVAGAATVAGSRDLAAAGRAMVLAGAVAFYLSDLFVALERFVSPGFGNQAVGLPLYYLGQFMLAFSVGHLA